MKNIGKPCAGEPHARFDEGGQGRTVGSRYPRLTKVTGTHTSDQHSKPALYSTPNCLIDDNLDEARRYEVYGRKVEANIERYRPKEKERLYKYVGGRP